MNDLISTQKYFTAAGTKKVNMCTIMYTGSLSQTHTCSFFFYLEIQCDSVFAVLFYYKLGSANISRQQMNIACLASMFNVTTSVRLHQDTHTRTLAQYTHDMACIDKGYARWNTLADVHRRVHKHIHCALCLPQCFVTVSHELQDGVVY